MHDLGDALMRAGFSEPVMDVEYFTLTYDKVLTLLKELKAIGAHNVLAGRQQTLTGKASLNKLIEEYEQYRADGLLPATYEVIYGHAWVGEMKKPQTSDLPNNDFPVPVLFE